jgi:hypothetical protein
MADIGLSGIVSSFTSRAQQGLEQAGGANSEIANLGKELSSGGNQDQAGDTPEENPLAGMAPPSSEATPE